MASVARDRPGLDNRGVLAWARTEQRVLVTFDTDFGDLIFRHGESPPPAVLLLRPQAREPDDALALVVGALVEPIEGTLVVVTPQGLRRRAF